MKITKDKILKIIKRIIVYYYKNVLGKPFLRKKQDNFHLKAFKKYKRFSSKPEVCLEKVYEKRWY